MARTFVAWVVQTAASCEDLTIEPREVGGAQTRTMSVPLYELSEAGNFEVLATFGIMLLAIALVLVMIGMKLAGRVFMLRRN